MAMQQITVSYNLRSCQAYKNLTTYLRSSSLQHHSGVSNWHIVAPASDGGFKTCVKPKTLTGYFFCKT